MPKSKKRLWIGIAVCACAVLLLFLGFHAMQPKDYTQAKKETVRFLNRNKADLQRIAVETLSDKPNRSRTYKKITYFYRQSDGKSYVQFDIDAQGMIGGQYWGILYCPTDDLINGSIEIYDEFAETGEGNNIFIKEKIADKWYFYYDDYDGTVDTNTVSQ